MRARTACIAVGLLVLTACGSKSQTSCPPENKPPAVDALDDAKQPGLEACRGSISSGDLERAARRRDRGDGRHHARER